MARRRIFRRIATVVAVMMLSLGLITPSASAFPRFRTPNLVVLGDSFASGVGNYPYQDANPCKRSDIAYGPILERLHLVHLQAFVACSGATTAQVSGSGPNGELAQINSITGDTDVITVQALGNDFAVGAIERTCFPPMLPDGSGGKDCDLNTPIDTPIGRLTVGSIIGNIPSQGLINLRALYTQIDIKRGPNPKSVVITPGYPNIIGNGGPFCPGVSADEIDFTAQMLNNLNTAIKTVSNEYHYRYAPVDSLFRRLDACAGPVFGIYPILPPSPPPYYPPPASGDPDFGGVLHPNQLGQSIYAGAVAKRLLF